MSKRSSKKDDPGMIFLIPELCSLTGISDVMRQDFSLMKEMSVYTHVGPNERYQQLNGFLQDIQGREEGRKELNKWQIHLDQKLVELTGRTIETETIIYKDVSHSIELKEKTKIEFHFSVQLNTIHWKPIGLVMVVHWHIFLLNISTNGLLFILNEILKLLIPLLIHSTKFAHHLVRTCLLSLSVMEEIVCLGMRVDFPEMIELPNDRSETFIRAIENKAHPQLDLVCCILTNNRKDRYDAIKKVLCVDCPLPSQVCCSLVLLMMMMILSRCFFREHYKNQVN